MPDRPHRRNHRSDNAASLAGAELTRHLHALGLESLDAYRAWCRRHGFRCGTDKSSQEQREERRAAEKEAADAQAHDELMRHVRSLGLATPEEYRAWCRRHAFSDALHKSHPQREQEWRLSRR